MVDIFYKEPKASQMNQYEDFEEESGGSILTARHIANS